MGSNASAAASTAPGRVREAVRAYTEAMNTKPRDERLRKFAIAEQLFRQLIAGGARHAPVRNADLYVNLGNAALQAEHLGTAIVAYRRALDLDPGHPRARQNLDYTRSLLPEWVQHEDPNRWIDSLFFWHATLSYGQILIVAALCFLAAAIMLAIGLVRQTLLWRNLALVPALGWLVLTISLIVDPGQTTAQDAVIITEAVLHTADSENAAARLPKPLPNGVEVKLLQHRERWSEVRLPDGRTGWVRNSTLELVANPQAR